MKRGRKDRENVSFASKFWSVFFHIFNFSSFHPFEIYFVTETPFNWLKKSKVCALQNCF